MIELAFAGTLAFDCVGIRTLAAVALLLFRPDQQIRKLRTYMRLCDNLVVASTQVKSKD